MVTPRQRGLSITATQTTVSVTYIQYMPRPEIHRQHVFLDLPVITHNQLAVQLLDARRPAYMCAFLFSCDLKLFSLWCLCCLAGIQTIDSTQALFLPIGASVSLLVMFFFFDSVQVVFTICTAGNCGSWAHHDNTTAVQWTFHFSCSAVALRESPLLCADHWNCKDH